MTNIRNGLTIFPYNMLEKTCAGFLSSLSGWGTNFEIYTIAGHELNASEAS
jgi:hypothetical protein